MSDYKPKVGEAFLFHAMVGDNWNYCNPAVFVSNKQVATVGDDGYINVISLEHKFKKAPTKQEVEHNELFEIILDGKNQGATSGQIATNIQKLCYTKVKKISPSQVHYALRDILSTDNEEIADAAIAICDLFREVTEDE